MPQETASRRLEATSAHIQSTVQDPDQLPWNPDSTSFPLRKDLVDRPGQPAGARWVWGENDYCGRLNLLTPSRIRFAAQQIQTGETAPLDLPSHIPSQPAFGRQVFHHEIKPLRPGKSYDDVYHMNTQSGTQWDGFRHISHQPTGIFYNNTTSDDFESTDKCSIHHWREHGFTGRGVLLDYKSYAEHHRIEYDTSSDHEISYEDLVKVGTFQNFDVRPQSQGGDILPGDILFVRSGWTKDYYSRSSAQNSALAKRKNGIWCGVKQEEAIITWLHDCYFAAVGGDAPAFEVWPTKQKYMLHEYLLALWGCPIGEMVDLEKVAEMAKKHQRYTFFVSSAPFRTVGGVASWLNATAIL